MVKFICVFILISQSVALGQEPKEDEVPFEITKKNLKILAGEVLTAFERHGGYKFKKAPTIKVSSSNEIATVLASEFKLQFQNFPDAPSAKKQSELFAPAVMGKYGYKNHVIFVNESAITQMSILMDLPELRRRDTLAAILIHELCHAMDHEKFGVMTKMHGLKDPELLIIWTHLIEGHAQFVARSICEKNGLKVPFELFTKSIGAVPGETKDDVAKSILIRTMVDQLAAQYYDGERFFHEIRKLGGDKAVEKVLVRPPMSTMELAVPAWYFDPTLRAKAPDFDKVTSAFAKKFSAPWKEKKLSLSAQHFKGVFAVLQDPPRTDPILSKVKANRGVAIVLGRGDKVITLVLMDFGNAASARDYLSLTQALLLKKDDLMKEGQVRITRSVYHKISGEHWRGKLSAKKIAVQKNELDVTSATIMCGQYAIEMMYSNEPIEKKDMVANLNSVVEDLIASLTKSK